MAYADLSFPDYPREQIRAGLLASGVPAAFVDEIADLGCHAAASARRAGLAVLDLAADPRVSTAAFGVAASLMKADAEQLLGALAEYGKTRGLPERRFQVGG